MSLWLDWIHLVGILSGILTFMALIIGLQLVFRIGGKGFSWQNKMRQTHMQIGIAAVSLAVLHTIFRLTPKGELPFELEPPFIAMWFFVIVAISGRLRFKPPESLHGKSAIMIWMHRSAAAVAILCLLMHSLHEAQLYFMQ